MIADQRAVLVIGAAGHQGSAAVRQLRARGFPVRALLEDSGNDATRAAQELGAWPVFADPTDDAALERAFDGVGTVVMVLDDPRAGPARRLHEGKAVAAAAARAGVGHIVYSAATGPDHHNVSCDLSREIERHMRGLDLPLTVLRPVNVMEEIPWYWLSRLGGTPVLATPFLPHTPLPLISIDDVGGVAAAAVANPHHFAGRDFDVAGDVVSVAELAELLGDSLGERVAHIEVQVEGVFIYQEAVTPPHDMEWLRHMHPGLHTVSSWLEHGGGLELCRRAVTPGRAVGAGAAVA